MQENKAPAAPQKIAPGPKSGFTEIFGGALLIGAILIFLALSSFQGQINRGQEPLAEYNLIGSLGHYSAEMLFLMFGKSAFLLAPYFLLLGVLTIMRGGFSDPLARLTAILIMILGSSIAGAILYAKESMPSQVVGGLIGARMGSIFQSLLGRYGSIIFSFGILMSGVFLAIRMPVSLFLAYIQTFIQNFLRRYAEIFSGGALSYPTASADQGTKPQGLPPLNPTPTPASSPIPPWIEKVERVEETPKQELAQRKERENPACLQGEEAPKNLSSFEVSQRTRNIQAMLAQMQERQGLAGDSVDKKRGERGDPLEEHKCYFDGYFDPDGSRFHFRRGPSADPRLYLREQDKSLSFSSSLKGPHVLDEPSMEGIRSQDLHSLETSPQTPLKGNFEKAETEQKREALKQEYRPEKGRLGETGPEAHSYRLQRNEEIKRAEPLQERQSTSSLLQRKTEKIEREREYGLEDERNMQVDERSYEDKQNTQVDERSYEDKRNMQVDERPYEDKQNTQVDERLYEDKQNTQVDERLYEDKQNMQVDERSYEDKQNTQVDGQAYEDTQDELSEDVLGPRASPEWETGEEEDLEIEELKHEVLEEGEEGEESEKPYTEGVERMYEAREGDKALPKSLIPSLQHSYTGYHLKTDFLQRPKSVPQNNIATEISETRTALKKVMREYGIQADVVGTQRGPIITLYEIKLEPGIKVSRVLGLESEICMNLAVPIVRIIAPIPGKSTIGIEIPNRVREPVLFSQLLPVPPSNLRIILGKNIAGENQYAELTQLPHLLIAGATGAGKSVYLNAVIASLLYQASPEDIRFVMIDPKMVELKLYEGIPHLLMPVITDVYEASKALRWLIDEMERRYCILSELRCRDIRAYNQRAKKTEEKEGSEAMPYIVVLIDELSDLMMIAAKDVEDSIIRLTQKARAVGIHIIMATQRPSVDVITALIKANCPARVAFQVAQRTDSRTILDASGAENLLGKGDLLYKSPHNTALTRIQAPLLSVEEVEAIVRQARSFPKSSYINLGERQVRDSMGKGEEEVDEEMFRQALSIVLEAEKTSTSYLQRRMRIGYNKAANLIEMMEERGYLSPPLGNKPREILKID